MLRSVTLPHRFLGTHVPLAVRHLHARTIKPINIFLLTLKTVRTFCFGGPTMVRYSGKAATVRIPMAKTAQYLQFCRAELPVFGRFHPGECIQCPKYEHTRSTAPQLWQSFVLLKCRAMHFAFIVVAVPPWSAVSPRPKASEDESNRCPFDELVFVIQYPSMDV